MVIINAAHQLIGGDTKGRSSLSPGLLPGVILFQLCGMRAHSCPKTVLRSKGLGVSFQAQTICPEVVERRLIFAYMAAAPQNKSF